MNYAAGEGFSDVFEDYGIKQKTAAEFRNRHLINAIQGLLNGQEHY